MRRWSSAISVIAVLLLLAACAPAPSTTPAGASGATVKPSGLPVLRLPSEDFGYPQPYTFSRGPGHMLLTFVFDTLVSHDPNGIVPWLAREWQVSPDGKTWTFTLRSGVKWHDGQPLTPDDIVFTFGYLKANPNPWWAGALEIVDRVEKRGEDGVAFVLTRPYAPFLTAVAASVTIMPKHVWESVPDPRAFQDARATMGSGPYILKEYDRAQGSYLFEANPAFFLGEPYVRRIELVPAANQLLALQQGQIDAAGAGTQEVPTNEVLAPFNDPAKFGVVTGPREWTMGLYFNMTRSGPLTDVRVRQAFAYAIDQADLVTRVLQGKGSPGRPGHLAPTSPWFNPQARMYPHAPTRAMQVLDDAGYRDANGDGVREGPDGAPLRFELLYSTWDSPRNAELLQSYAQAVGIALTPRALERNALDTAAAEGRYEMVLVGFGGIGGDPDGLRTKFHSASRARTFTRAQGYSNPRFDELADRQLAESDPAQRRALVNDMQETLADDVPMLSLYYPEDTWIFRKGTLDDWYLAYGWYGGGVQGAFKRLFVTGQREGIAIKGR